uniref:UCH domain-containing protein n=1 Tax=Macrostomum lignano TaxID=282301 RepID=A0A1I8F4X9_9PLAT
RYAAARRAFCWPRGAAGRSARLTSLASRRLPQLLCSSAAFCQQPAKIDNDSAHSPPALADLLTSGLEHCRPSSRLACCAPAFIQLELRLLCEAAHLFQRLSLLSTPVASWSSFAGLVAFLAGALPSGMEPQLRQLFDRLLFTPDFVDSLSSDSTGLDLELKHRAGSRIAGPLLPQDWVWLPLLTTRADDEEEDTDEAAREAAASEAGSPSRRPVGVFVAYTGRPAAAGGRLLSAAVSARSLDTEAPVPGVANFYDAWTDALRHYQGAGYGDAHFANALLIPCGLRHHVKYRRAQSGAKMSACLRVLPLRFDQLPAAAGAPAWRWRTEFLKDAATLRTGTAYATRMTRQLLPSFQHCALVRISAHACQDESSSKLSQKGIVSSDCCCAHLVLWLI